MDRDMEDSLVTELPLAPTYHLFVCGIFHEIDHPFWGSLIDGNPQTGPKQPK